MDQWVSPLVRQASFAMAAPEVIEKMVVTEHLVEFLSPIRERDLIYPVLKITGVDSGEAGDAVHLETMLRCEGEPVQRHVITYAIGERPAAEAPAHPDPPDLREPLQPVADGAHAVAAALRAIIERRLGGDPERVRRLNSVFFEEIGTRQLEVVCWKDGASENGLRELPFQLREAQGTKPIAFGTVWFS